VDLGIVVLPIQHGSVVTADLGRDELVAIARPGHRWNEATRVRARDFIDEPLVVYERNSHTFRIIERFLLEEGVFPRFAMEISDLEAVKRMVEAGLGVAVMARWMIREEVERGSLIARPLGTRGLHRSWGVLHRSNEALTASQKGFLSICRSRFLELVTERTAP
jgi:DNA-binding transcriptional LysR family regulator